MTKFLEKLTDCLPFLHAKWFAWFIGIIIFLNPLAVFPQLMKAITAPSVEGLSIFMFLIFAIIQVALVFVGIQKLDWRMFISMGISFLETIAIVVIVLFRQIILT